ncbi:hypothetical protein [Streptomyces nitrosporeus]|uniref:hypothetical protein n=1 Tax=Streptomyces nitrosporeus TaxID=28894 RepID=UPI00167E6C31|nr:hypothetical protein [Streptomyces nitrosporeus]GGZ28073.1 hypothetical protein GCM10010327_68180 [Streptomyces nitrosporeus]
MLVVPRYESMQYDGTNGELLAEWALTATYVETFEDGTLSLLINNYGLVYDQQVKVGWWALRSSGMWQGAMSPEMYAREWAEIPGT